MVNIDQFVIRVRFARENIIFLTHLVVGCENFVNMQLSNHRIERNFGTDGPDFKVRFFIENFDFCIVRNGDEIEQRVRVRFHDSVNDKVFKRFSIFGNGHQNDTGFARDIAGFAGSIDVIEALVFQADHVLLVVSVLKPRFRQVVKNPAVRLKLIMSCSFKHRSPLTVKDIGQNSVFNKKFAFLSGKPLSNIKKYIHARFLCKESVNLNITF